MKTFGKENQHLKLHVQCAERIVECVGFNMGNVAEQIKGARHVDIAFEVAENTYFRTPTLELHLQDLRLSQTK